LIGFLYYFSQNLTLNLTPKTSTSGYEPDELPTAPPRDIGPQRYEVVGNIQALFEKKLIFF